MLDQAQKLRQMMDREFTSYNQQPENGPRIITVTSGKGGVGKSNFVVNLSITLQKLGKKVLIFDADIGMGNDDVLMGFLPKYNVFDTIYENKEIEEVLIEGPYGVKLLPGGSGLNNVEGLTEIERGIFLKKLTQLKDLDYVIMDTGAGISRTVLAFVSCCEELIVVTTPEPTSLTDAYSLMKAINHFKLKDKAKIIVNRAFDKKEAQITFNKFNNAVSNFLKMEVEFLGSIAEDRKLVQSVRAQKPFVLGYPNSEAARDINAIAMKLQGENTCTEKGMGVEGLFKKIFKIFS